MAEGREFKNPHASLVSLLAIHCTEFFALLMNAIRLGAGCKNIGCLRLMTLGGGGNVKSNRIVQIEKLARDPKTFVCH
jgi:hypothetical protein